MKKRIITQGLIENFEKELWNSEKSKNTVDKYIRDIRNFEKFINNQLVEKELVLEYKAKLRKEYALTSANSMLISVNLFFKFTGWIDCCVKCFKIQRNAYCSENSELTKQEYIALVRAAEHENNERLSMIIQTICGTGIRVSELKFITVEAVKEEEAIVTCKGKTRKVFIVKDLCKKLINYSKERGITSGVIFITKNGAPMNRSNIWREMKALCVQAGVSPQKVFPHSLRHLFARIFYSIEKDIVKLADILGHESINTTRIYIVSSGTEHRRRLETMRLII